MMSSFLMIFIFSVIAVALLILGLAITIIRKGRPMQSEVGENDEMKKRGLSCASDQFRQEEAELRGTDCDTFSSCKGGCGTCKDN